MRWRFVQQISGKPVSQFCDMFVVVSVAWLDHRTLFQAWVICAIQRVFTAHLKFTRLLGFFFIICVFHSYCCAIEFCRMGILALGSILLPSNRGCR